MRLDTHMKNFKLFVEISEEEAKKVRDLHSKRTKPIFDHLFEGKDRVFFPLPPDRDVYKLKKILEQIPHPRNPDMPKYKININDMRMGVVRLLQKAKHPEKGEYISDKNTTTMGRALNNEKNNPEIQSGNFEKLWTDIQPYWVVVSRHPIDVKRMGDFINVQSCHTPGGDYYKCTDEEVESGGAVAYLISANDIGKVDKSADEIFADKGFIGKDSGSQLPGRNIEGIHPVARTRIRRLVNTQVQGEEIAAVETAVYGIEEGGHLSERFLKAVRHWVNTKQPDISPNKTIDYNIRGGSYTDSSVAGMNNYMYQRNPAYISRLLTKLQKLDDDDAIKSELEKFTGNKPPVVTRMGGRKLWVGDIFPTSPAVLFRNSWIADYASHDINRLLDPEMLIKMLSESVNMGLMDQFEKYVINMFNRSGSAKLIKIGEDGWTIVMPVETWIHNNSTPGNRRAARLSGEPSLYALMSNLNYSIMKKKFFSIFGGGKSAPEKTGPFPSPYLW